MVTVGTFNLNNLFSRFNFRAEISHDQGGDGHALEASYTFADPDAVRVRRYQGRLVTGKDEAGRAQVAQRLLGSHPSIQVHPPEVDVWAVQEVEARQAASGEDWPAPETPRVRAKAGRKTVDLPPQRYAALIEWRAESPRQLGVARVIGQKCSPGWSSYYLLTRHRTPLRAQLADDLRRDWFRGCAGRAGTAGTAWTSPDRQARAHSVPSPKGAMTSSDQPVTSRV
jgi:hypothetical protein